ncbi:MAG: winged helix-turn-helix domain-containing protein [Anaerolineae bacterium]|nr:winged helix-turn-helix domain-containing protein [Anaerolineae bacterium]
MPWLTLIGRTRDVEEVRTRALRGACVSLVGVSNVGKTALMRRLSETRDTRGTFVYMDCNTMPERTTRAFWLTIWHALAERLASAPPIITTLLESPDATTFALHFERGLVHALETLPRPLVLLLDDFDEAFQTLEPQVFLNLRAFKDRYRDALTYVTATHREFARMPMSREQGEFVELCAPHVHYLRLMTHDDTREFCTRYAAREGITFSDADVAFVHANAGGHPGLTLAVCCVLGRETGAPTRNVHQDRVIHQVVQPRLARDPNVRIECEKIWRDLDEEERHALYDLARADAVPSLHAKHIVRESDAGYVIFAPLFADFVRRQRLTQQPHARGVYVDVDAGVAYVEGRRVEDLTDLEYRLLTFLYGRLDRVCDKYSIVENVWGQQFIDEVDDARIEKLVSRLRAKIEPDPSKPRYLISVRGRGYKLVA